jgi:hypothetical protein
MTKTGTAMVTEKGYKYVLKASRKGHTVYYGDRNGELGFSIWLDYAILFDEDKAEKALEFIKKEEYIGSKKLDDMGSDDFIILERIECKDEDLEE